MSRQLRSHTRRVIDRLEDARAEVAVLFYAVDLPRPRHDQAGHADRALRDLRTELEELFTMLTGMDDRGQMHLAM